MQELTIKANRLRVRPSLVISVLALVIASTSGAYAAVTIAAKNSVVSKSIKNSQVKELSTSRTQDAQAHRLRQRPLERAKDWLAPHRRPLALGKIDHPRTAALWRIPIRHPNGAAPLG